MPRTITGRDLAHKKRTPTQRALLAADLASGRVIVTGLTLRQATMLTGASPSYASVAARLDGNERIAVARGWRRLLPYSTKPAMPTPKPALVNDAELIELVRSVGIDRTLAAAVAVEIHA
jgi:hypothetical protein